jgi:hypothetical protein
MGIRKSELLSSKTQEGLYAATRISFTEVAAQSRSYIDPFSTNLTDWPWSGWSRAQNEEAVHWKREWVGR